MKNETKALVTIWALLVAGLFLFISFLRVADKYEATLKEAKIYCIEKRVKPNFCTKLF